MSTRKAINTFVSIFMIASLLLGATTPASAKEPQTSVVASSGKSMPMPPVDETKVPHYFGPYPNWANSPFTLPNASVAIQNGVGSNGSGATAVANVDPMTGAITSIDVTSPGSDYKTVNVIISGGDGNPAHQATATATINSSGAVVAVNIDANGGGYTAPTVTFSGGGATTDATGVVYGGVDAVTVNNSGFGYTMPTVEFDLPDAPDGVIAKGHVASTALGDSFDGMNQAGEIAQNGVIVDEPGSGYLTPPNVTIRNGTSFDPISGATPAVASTTLLITSVAISNVGSGYTSAPQVQFNDPTGTNASATAVVDVGAVTGISVVSGGSGYLQVGMHKFIDDLPGLCNPGTAVGTIPACPASGKYIPLAVPTAKVYDGIEADEYVIGVVQYRTSFSSDLPPTLVRGYVQINPNGNTIPGSQNVPLTNTVSRPDPQNPGQFIDVQVPVPGLVGVTPPQWLGPIISATKDKPVRIVFRNLLPKGSDGDLFLPADSSLMGSGMVPMDMGDGPKDRGTVLDEVRNPMCTGYPKGPNCFKDNRATLHLHGGTTPWISDGTAHQWITPAGEATGWPQGVSVSNVPDMVDTTLPNSPVLCDAKDDGCQTFYYTNQQSARLLFYHDHSWGITRLNVYAGEAAGYVIRDSTETGLLTSGAIPADEVPLVIQDRTFVPDAAQLALQDPTWDTARWGTKGNFWYHHVYMPAQNPGDPSGMSAYGRWMYGPWFWPPAAATMYGPIDNPYYLPSCNLDDPLTWQYPTDPFCEPQQIPGTPNISVGMEQFNDTPVVNGVAYPKVTLLPKSYRLRILNAANDRFWNLQWYIADPTQGNGLTEVALKPEELAAAQNDPNVSPTPDTTVSLPGPDWIQIGTEGGFLPAPAVIDGQQPTTWITDPTRFDVGNVDQHSLLLAPAERADVIVDFSKFAGKTLILYNDAPAAFPARVSSYDYYTGAPDLSPVGAPKILPGYGPNTRTIMQVTIGSGTNSAFDLTKLQNAFRHNLTGTGVFEAGQHPIIVGQAGYNSAYGTSFAASSNCNAPGSTQQRCDGYVRVNDTMEFGFNTLRAPNVKSTMPLQPKAIHDEMNATTFDEYGRMQANLGVEAQPPTPGLQNVTLYPFVNPATELIDGTNLPKAHVLYDNNGRPVSDVKITPIADAGDGTQIWRITHNGVDTHPIHFHLYDVQLVNRVTWDNIIIPPDANELGWKDTVRISPLEDTIVALRPIIPEVPFEVPNAARLLNPMMLPGSDKMFNPVDPSGNPASVINQLVNFGWEYVYHCHILSHEEMDMMRPVSVALPPKTPDTLSYVTVDVPNTNPPEKDLILSWMDNSITETAFVVQRSAIPNVWQDLDVIDQPLDATDNPVKQNNHGLRSYTDTTYVDGTAYDYRIVARNTVGYMDGDAGFPEMTVQSVSETLHVGPAMVPSVVSINRASANPSSAPTVNFTVTFSQAVSGVDSTDFQPTSSGTISGPAISAINGSGTTYTISVSTGTGTGTLGLLLKDNDSIMDAQTQAVPLGGTGVYGDQTGDGSFLNGQTYTIDYTPPTVVSSVRMNAATTALAAVNFRVTFNESVTGVDKTDFSFTNTGFSTQPTIASVTGTGATRTVKVNTGTGSGTIRLDVVDNDSIKDTVLVPLGGLGAGNGNFNTGQVYVIDRGAPFVASSTRLDASPSPHGILRYNVTFSEAVSGVDVSDFNVIPSGTITNASVASVTGGNITYTVAINTGGLGSGTVALKLADNDTIKDVMSYPLGGVGTGNGDFTVPQAQIYAIDPAPSVTAIARALPSNWTNANSVSYNVTFSEPVNGVDSSDFAFANGSITSASLTSVSGSGANYTVVVNTGTADGTIGLNLVDDDSISSIATGFKLGGLGTVGTLGDGSFTGEVYDVDKTAPTVAITTGLPNPTGATNVDYTVTFSEPVSGVDTVNFTLTPTGVQQASITGFSGTGADYIVSVATGINNGTLELNISTTPSTNIIDRAGNALTGVPLANGAVYTIAKIPPTVSSIARALTTDTTNASSVSFTVTFSEAVSGVDLSDFALTAGSIGDASLGSVAPADQTGAAYTVVVNTGTGNGTIGLKLVDDDSIRNGFNIPLGGTGTVGTPGDGSKTGQSYSIDRVAPTVSSITRASANPTNAATVNYTVIFSEAVKDVDTADFVLTQSDVAGSSVASVTAINGSQTDYTVVINTGVGLGTLRLDVPSTATVTDLAGNALGSFTGDQLYTTTIAGQGAYDDMSTAWTYTGSWATTTSGNFYNGTLHYSITAGNYATATIDGSMFSLSYTQYPSRGRLDVYDGATKIGTITQTGTTAYQSIWVSPNLGPGRHNLKFVHLDGSSVDIDGIRVYDPLPAGGPYDDNNIAWNYFGSWLMTTGASYYSSTLHYSTAVNSYALVPINGAKFTLYYTQFSSRGSMDVYDGMTKIGTITETGSTVYQKTWVSPNLGVGNHMLKFVYVSGASIDIDAIQVSTPLDVIPPAAISNLTATPGATTGSVNLSWTAPGDDGNIGTATSYLVRYSTSAINSEATWNTATVVSTGIPTPLVADTPQSMTVNGLTPGATYYFAVRAQDEELNLGGLSNLTSSAAQGILPLSPNATPYDDSDPAWTYAGSWLTTTNSSFYNSTLHYSTTPNSYATVQITGTHFTLYYTQFSNRGVLDVYDGTTKIGTITQTGSTVYQRTWNSPTLVGSGTHTIKFVYVSGPSVDIDAIRVLP